MVVHNTNVTGEKNVNMKTFLESFVQVDDATGNQNETLHFS